MGERGWGVTKPPPSPMQRDANKRLESYFRRRMSRFLPGGGEEDGKRGSRSCPRGGKRLASSSSSSRPATNGGVGLSRSQELRPRKGGRQAGSAARPFPFFLSHGANWARLHLVRLCKGAGGEATPGPRATPTCGIRRGVTLGRGGIAWSGKRSSSRVGAGPCGALRPLPAAVFPAFLPDGQTEREGEPERSTGGGAGLAEPSGPSSCREPRQQRARSGSGSLRRGSERAGEGG